MDILYTFHNVGILRNHTKNWSDAEYNPLVRTSWHIFGFGNGTIIAAAITLLAVIGACFFVGDREFLQGVLIGAFFMVHHYHFITYSYISKKYLGKDSKLIDRIISNI
ncbi:MAG: hypothetical protein ABH851_04870 [Methanobacteriota archaeon]